MESFLVFFGNKPAAKHPLTDFLTCGIPELCFGEDVNSRSTTIGPAEPGQCERMESRQRRIAK